VSYTYLQERGGESLAASFSDIPVSVLSKSRNTHARSCCNASGTACCHDFQSGMTSAHSTELLGEDKSMSSQAASHAKTSVPQEKAQDWLENDPVYGLRWRELSARFDRDTSLWKIHPCLFPEDSMSCSVTLPRWGMMLGGELSALIMPALPTGATESGFWPTPMGHARHAAPLKNNRGELNLAGQVRVWPTPKAPDGKMGMTAVCSDRPKEKSTHLQTQVGIAVGWKAGDGGHLNPPWVAWLMGWPIGWTDSRRSGMDRFRQWLRSHGDCLEGQSDAKI
jgi:hypothetical protein